MKEFIFCALLGPALGVILTLTGCTAFALKQFDQDVATSTVEPLKSFRALELIPNTLMIFWPEIERINNHVTSY
jgi:hypothetical protein